MVQYLSGMDCGHPVAIMVKGSYDTRSLLFYLRARPRIIFSRSWHARAAKVSEANQQFHFKSSQCGMKLLCTDSWLPPTTVPMDPPMSNSSMLPHREPILQL